METDKEIDTDQVLLFQQHLSRLRQPVSLGFKLSSLDKVPATKVAPESYKLHLDEGGKDRSIDVIFYPLPNDEGIILVHINNLKNGQVLNVKDWLKKHGQLSNPQAFKLASYSGAREEKWSKFSEFLNDVLSQESMRTILNGESWEDIPFDWTGIK